MIGVDGIQDHLLTSSDFETLIADLKSDNNSYHLHVDQDYTQIQENVKHITNDLQTNGNPSSPIEDYTHIQNHGQTNDLQIHGNPSTPLENYMAHEINEPPETALNIASVSYSPTCTIPCKDNFSGPLNFEVFLDSESAHRRSWVYSQTLNKVFIDMNKSMLVQFRIKDYVNGLSVRALPVYSMDDYISTPVQRCDLHILNDDVLRKSHGENSHMCFCASYKWVRHVVRSNHSLAHYEYDCESDRHSVRVPLEAPQAGSDTAVVEYYFTCKTSCARGMNRKPIDVIFTLETEQMLQKHPVARLLGNCTQCGVIMCSMCNIGCYVLGRYVLPVKICSCPKRDKEKEELDIQNKNKEAPILCGPGKRRVSNSTDKIDISKKIKTENIILRKNGVAHENGDDNNKMEISDIQSSLLSQIVGLKTMVANQRQELVHLREEMVRHREEMVHQREEMVRHREEIMSKLLQHQSELGGLSNRIEPILGAIYHIMKPDQV